MMTRNSNKNGQIKNYGVVKMDERFCINVKKLMVEQELPAPKCKLPKPKLKPTVFITGWNEWLQIITVECEI